MENQWQKDILLECYPKHILKTMRANYSNKKTSNLIKNGFTFEQFVLKLHKLGYIDSNSHQIRRLDTSRKFDENNIYLKKSDGLITKLKKMSQIIEKNERPNVKLKINEQNPFQICLKHPSSKWERRIYIKQ